MPPCTPRTPSQVPSVPQPTAGSLGHLSSALRAKMPVPRYNQQAESSGEKLPVTPDSLCVTTTHQESNLIREDTGCAPYFQIGSPLFPLILTPHLALPPNPRQVPILLPSPGSSPFLEPKRQ